MNEVMGGREGDGGSGRDGGGQVSEIHVVVRPRDLVVAGVNVSCHVVEAVVMTRELIQ